MERAVVVRNMPGACRIRLDRGGYVQASNALNRRPPLGAIVIVEKVRGRYYLVGRPR